MNSETRFNLIDFEDDIFLASVTVSHTAVGTLKDLVRSNKRFYVLRLKEDILDQVFDLSKFYNLADHIDVYLEFDLLEDAYNNFKQTIKERRNKQ